MMETNTQSYFSELILSLTPPPYQKCVKSKRTEEQRFFFGLPLSLDNGVQKRKDFDLNGRTDLKNHFCYYKNHLEEVNYFLSFHQ